MATIKINDEFDIKGKVSFSHSITYNEETDKWEDCGVVGQLSTHKYCDDIHSIETDRYIIKDCIVCEEIFGSEDFDIVYKFIADSCIIKDDPISEAETSVIESKKYAYEESDKFLFGIKDKD